MTQSRRSVAARAIALGAIVALSAGLSLVATSAVADTMPTNPANPASPETVAGDALPTAQIDGVAWTQAVVGNTVFVGGSFATARPAGAAPGTSTVVRSNILAYDITTGVLLGFAPVLNAQVLAITSSPDGSRIYVTGDFTAINGTPYYRIAAFDTATGAVIPSFKPVLGSQGRSLQATNTTVYVGGIFRTVSGQPRDFLASINAADGAVNPWVASADASVDALALTKDGSKLVAGGRFTTLSGNAVRGIAAVDPTTGASVPWAASAKVRNAGTQSAITSLYATEDRVYGTGYVYAVDRTVASGNLEGTFSANPATGAIIWIEDCHGDSYSAFPQGDAIYVASHSHYCGNIGGFQQTDPWVMHYATAFSRAATGTITTDPMGYFNWAGNPSPTVLDWFPKLTPGTYTGQGQAGWSVSGNASYVTYAGEFGTANGIGQQGLVRFAVKTIAPNKVAPITNVELVPTTASLQPGTARISWLATYDYDNANLTYKLVRDGLTATPIYTVTQASNFYLRPAMGFTDTGLAPGSTHTYRVYVTDPYGNSTSRLAPTVTVATSDPNGGYENAVLADNPTVYWPLDETTGTMSLDHKGTTDLATGAGVVRGVNGIVSGQKATTFTGEKTATALVPGVVAAPSTFSSELWMRTTTTTGGRLLGFGNGYTGLSTTRDRQIYMDNAGRLWFGVSSGTNRTVNSATSFNDGEWHHVVAQLGGTGMRLYVDGQLVGSRTDTTSALAYSGYWRLGGDSLTGWTNAPSTSYFSGDIAQVALYSAPLSLSQIQSHFTASGRTVFVPGIPTPEGLAIDDFDRTIAAGFGTAPTGGAWTISGTTDFLRVDAGTGVMAIPAGSTRTATLASTQVLNSDTVVSFSLDGVPTGDGAYTSIRARQNGAAYYAVNAWGRSNGSVVLVLRQGAGVLTTATVPGLTYAAGQSLTMRFQASGTSPTVLKAKLWPTGTTEPSAWLVTANDSTVGLQIAGAPGLQSAITANSTAPVTTRFDNLLVASTEAGLPPVVPNVAPVGAFSVSSLGLTASVDSSASTDADGTILGRSWDWGDSTSGTGVTPSHTYASAGTYTITLTLTDDDGASSTVVHPVTVSTPPPPPAGLAADDFERTVSPGWGAATTGGSWTIAGTTDFLRVEAGTGIMAIPAGSTRTASLASSPVLNSDAVVSFALDGVPTGDGAYTSIRARQNGAAYYAVNAWGRSNGSVVLVLRQGSTVLITGTVPGMTYTPGLSLTLRLQVNGVSPTTLKAKLWPTGTAEPGAWLVTATDSTAGLQVAGASALQSSITANSTSSVTTRFDNFVISSPDVVVPPPPVPNVAPVGAFSVSSAALTASVDSSASTDSDGTIVSRSWDWGDATSDVGIAPNHTYASAGTYTITLTLTDDDGDSSTVTRPVTVAVPPPPPAGLAVDDFERTVAAGWGTATTGGNWTITGTTAFLRVDGGAGVMALPAGSTRTAALNGTPVLNSDTQVSFALDGVPTGDGAYTTIMARQSATGNYAVNAWARSSGAVVLVLRQGAAVLTTATVPGLTYTPGLSLTMRLQVTGTNPTTLRAKLWTTGTTEPATWLVSATDSTAALQVAGAPALQSAITSTSTAPVNTRFDNLIVLAQ